MLASRPLSFAGLNGTTARTRRRLSSVPHPRSLPFSNAPTPTTDWLATVAGRHGISAMQHLDAYSGAPAPASSPHPPKRPGNGRQSAKWPYPVTSYHTHFTAPKRPFPRQEHLSNVGRSPSARRVGQSRARVEKDSESPDTTPSTASTHSKCHTFSNFHATTSNGRKAV